MARKNKPTPWAKGIIDPLIEGLNIKESLELRDKINKYDGYWSAKLMGAWAVIVVFTLLVIQGWALFASWGFCDDLVTEDYAPLMGLFMALGLVPISSLMWCSTFKIRLMKHIKDLAGVEDDKSD